MRRVLAVLGLAGLLALGACSTSSSPGIGEDTTGDPSVTVPAGNNPVTGPADQARSVVGQQNAQLQQEEQQTGYEDPTVP
jgi:hypothetical protein